MANVRKIAVLALAALLGTACETTRPPQKPAESAALAASAAPAPSGAPSATPEASAPPPPGSVILAAAGDIADCDFRKGEEARLTGELVRKRDVPVIIPGDLAYDNGTTSELAGCYDKLWGKLKAGTYPAPGNHEYGLYEKRNDAAPYFAYFGASAGPPGEKGYYSFDLGAWHIVSLNSMAGVAQVAGRAPSMEEQIGWLGKDLESSRKPCTLAFWHHPLFSSGGHGKQASDPGRHVDKLWEVLLAHGADVVVNGHDHDYERFAPQTADGKADAGGIRQFVVGTGGAKLGHKFPAKPNSEVFFNDDKTDYGVLFFTLRPDGYEWQFERTHWTNDKERYGDRSTKPEPCHAKKRHDGGP